MHAHCAENLLSWCTETQKSAHLMLQLLLATCLWSLITALHMPVHSPMMQMFNGWSTALMLCVGWQAATRSGEAASSASLFRQQGRGRSPSPGPSRGRSPGPVSGVNSRCALHSSPAADYKIKCWHYLYSLFPCLLLSKFVEVCVEHAMLLVSEHDSGDWCVQYTQHNLKAMSMGCLNCKQHLQTYKL